MNENETSARSPHDDRVLDPHYAYAVLRDGRQVLIRPLASEDRTAVAALLSDLSLESRAQRFHSAGLRITAATIDAVTAGHVLVAELGEHMVALASYVAQPAATTQAEVAIMVADAEQGHGIGTMLCEHLAHDAQRTGIRQAEAEVLRSNRRMLALLRNLAALGFHITRTIVPGAIRVRIELCQG